MNIHAKIRPAVIACGIFAASCGNDASSADAAMTTIPVHSDCPALDPAECISDIEYFPLETNDGNLLGNYRRPVIKDSLILFLDGQTHTVKIFDLKGKAVGIVDRLGKGPQEYNYIQAAQLTPDGEILIIDDWNKKSALYYDLSGNFLRKKKLPETLRSCIMSVDYLDRENLILEIYDVWGFGTNKPTEKDLTGYTYDRRSLLALADSSFEIRQAAFPNQSSSHIVMTNNVTFQRHTPEEFYYTHPCCDTIYRITSAGIAPAYHIDLSRVNGFPPLGPEIRTVQDLMKAAEGHARFSGSLTDLDNAVLIKYTPADPRNPGMLAYDKRDGQTYSFEPKTPDDNLLTMVLLQAMVGSLYRNDRMFAVIPAYVIQEWLRQGSPEQIRKAGFPESLRALTNESNPVLVSFRFRLPEKNNPT